jgi:hypothetical protein
MAGDSLIDDVARATAVTIVEVFAPCLREEEQREAFVEVYTRVKAGLERYQLREARLCQRVKPGTDEEAK